MKPPLFLFLLTSFTLSLFSQETLRKYPIGESGCSAYFFTEPAPATMEYSPDSSRVYIMESTDNEGITCSVITVALAEELAGDDIEAVMTSYMDFLQEQFNVLEASGYAGGNTLPDHPSAIGIRDYWIDAESEMEVMGYSDGKFIAVMLIYADDNEKDITGKSATFFRGFRFPGD
jgi:hypothetical protein